MEKKERPPVYYSEYLQLESKNKSFIGRFFKLSTKEKIAGSISELASKTEFSIHFPYINFDQKIQFLYRCNDILKRLNEFLIHDTPINRKFITLKRHFLIALKNISHSIFVIKIVNNHDINLNYLIYYLDAVSCGLECPTNYGILKEQVLNALYHHVHYHSKNIWNPLLILAMDSIENDIHGINQHADNNREKFNNLVKLLIALESMLIEKQDDVLLPILRKILYQALEIDSIISLVAILHDLKQQNQIKMG